MHLFDKLASMGHEEIAMGSDPASGYRGIVAVHSTRLGPALGGTRFWSYDTDDEAITYALRLSRGMTYKNAVAGLDLGGGKSVIIGDNRTKNREAIFRAHGRAVESLGGRYITAEDVGTGTADMDYVHLETEHVAGLKDKSGDPSPVTAHGVFRAIQASAKNRWGSDDLSGKVVTIQGVGNVGRYLAKELHEAGAKLIVSDIDPERTARVARETGASVVEGDAIYNAKADIFAPCALGGIINDDTLPKLRVEVICGGANNQLLEERHGYKLEEMGMQYTPDYVANAGGVINVFGEVAGWDSERALRKADEIYDTVLSVFEISKTEGIPSFEAADRLAERRLGQVQKKWTPRV